MSPVAVDLFVRALVLLVSAWLVVTLLRRRSASLRALVWTVALAGVLVLPAMAAFAPAIEVPVWRAEALDAPVFGGRTFRSGGLAGSKDPASDGRVSADVSANSSDLEVRPAKTAAAAFAGPAGPASEESGRPVSLGQVALFVWGLVSLVLVARIGASHFSLYRLARSGHASTKDRNMTWSTLVDETRAALGIRRTVRVCTTDAVGVPAMAGLFRPVLLLPAEADNWSDDVKRAVVLHELAHVARWDAAGQLVSQLACAAYWCVPLAWHGARRAAVLREQASDDVVLMSGVRASAYAENLLNVARLTGNVSLEPATLAMAHPRRIRERIVAILDPASVRTVLHARSLAAVSLTAAAVVALVATVQPVAQAAPAPMPDATPVTVEPRREIRSESPRSTSDPLPQASSLRPCDKDMDNNSSSSHDDGKTKRWMVKMSGASCKVDLRVDGTVEFNETFTDVKSLSRGGSFKLDVTEGSVRRELEIVEKNGAMDRVYRVDGRERSFDSDGQAWLSAFLVTLDRRTAFGVDYRLPLLLKQGGVGAVLNETALMSSDYARSRYYEKLMAARQLSDGERAQVLKQAASMTKSDHYASVVLAEVAKGGFQNGDVRAAALSMIERMESDHYRSTAVANVVGAGRPTAGDMDVLVRTVERMTSDHYKLEVLRRLVSGPLQPQHRTALARAARTVNSDHHAAEFLKALMTGGADGVERQVFFDVIGTIESDHYVLEVLKSLVAQQTPSRAEFQHGVRTLTGIESDHYRNEAVQTLMAARDLTEADLLSAVGAITPMSSDHHKSEALRSVASHRAATDRVRTAVIDASDRMSSHYREQVRRAAGK